MPDTSSTLRTLIERQLTWAAAREIDLDDAGQTLDPGDNLFAPLSPATHAELATGPGRPLGDGDKPGPIQSLQSTEALGCNLFDYWRERELDELQTAVGVEHGIHELAFAATHPTGVDDLCGHADILLSPEQGPVTGIVTSFAEPYCDVDPRAPSALIDRPDAWSALNGCRALARDLRANPGRFRRLPAGRILSLAQAMTRAYGVREFRLLYLWYEVPGRAAEHHRQEIDRLRMRIGGEVDCVTRTWQDLYVGLRRLRGEHGRYLDYLGERYFPEN